MIDILLHDRRYALRGLRRAPGFTLTVMATLGLGIGANVAMFDVTDRLMFRPFPFLRDPSSVQRVHLQTTIRGKTSTQSIMPYTRYLDLRRESTAFSAYAGFSEWRLAVGEEDATRSDHVARIWCQSGKRRDVCVEIHMGLDLCAGAEKARRLRRAGDF